MTFHTPCGRPWADSADATYGWMCVHAWNDSDWFQFHTVSDFSVAASQSPLAICFPLTPAPLKDKLQMIKVGGFFCIQSPKHNADASSNEVIIMHITDIKRNELKSLHV